VKRLALAACALTLAWPIAARAEDEPPPADEARTEAATTEPSPPPRRIGIFRVDAGFAPRRVFDIPILGGEIDVALGVEGRKGVGYFPGLRGTLGKTELGLTVRSWHFGSDFELLTGRVRPGVGFALFWVEVDRAARRSSASSYGHSFRGYVRFDVARAESFAFYLRATIDFAHEFQGGAVFWGGTLATGFDFDLTSRRAP
jgi:hypothetical protein